MLAPAVLPTPGHAKMRDIAMELRQRAAEANEDERADLLFLAAEYDAFIDGDSSGDPAGDFFVILPK